MLLCQDDEKIPLELRQVMANKVNRVIDLFRLRNAANTIIGDDLIRGVSGGERKRVTLAEMIMGISRVFALGGCMAVCLFMSS